MRTVRTMTVALAHDDLDRLVLDHATLAIRVLKPRLVHVVRVLPEDGGTDRGRPEREQEAIDAEVHEILGASPATEVRTHVERGPSLDALLGHLDRESVDLVMLGHHRTGRTSALARRLARKAPCAVWMVPQGAPATLSCVVVPADFSPSAGAALDAALELCRATGMPECILVNVHHADGDSVARRDGEAELARFLAGRETTGVSVRPAFESAEDVASGVDAVAARSGADLICMGSRGRSRSTAVLLGSATEDVLTRMRCGVLVVRAPGGAPSFARTFLRRVLTDDDRPRFG